MSEEKDKYCGYFLAKIEDDRHMFFLDGLLYCSKSKCQYGNSVGNPLTLECEGLPVYECITNGLKVADTLKANDTSELVKKVEDEPINPEDSPAPVLQST